MRGRAAGPMAAINSVFPDAIRDVRFYNIILVNLQSVSYTYSKLYCVLYSAVNSFFPDTIRDVCFYNIILVNLQFISCTYSKLYCIFCYYVNEKNLNLVPKLVLSTKKNVSVSI